VTPLPSRSRTARARPYKYAGLATHRRYSSARRVHGQHQQHGPVSLVLRVQPPHQPPAPRRTGRGGRQRLRLVRQPRRGAGGRRRRRWPRSVPRELPPGRQVLLRRVGSAATDRHGARLRGVHGGAGARVGRARHSVRARVPPALRCAVARGQGHLPALPSARRRRRPRWPRPVLLPRRSAGHRPAHRWARLQRQGPRRGREPQAVSRVAGIY
jgi:hypothetical protein